MGFVLWHDGVGEGFDRCVVTTLVDGHRFQGTARVPDLGGSLRYEVVVDGAWEPRHVEVRVDVAPGVRDLVLSRADGAWAVDGGARDDLEGCRDVWLDLSPVGLTPTLRHRALDVDQEVRYPVVAIDVAAGTVHRAEHTLARLDADHYRHGTEDGDRQVHVGPKGLVVEYEDAWKAVAFA